MSGGLELERFEEEKRYRERQVLFANESFALGALQTVSAAASFGIVNQMKALEGAAGQLAILCTLTLLAFALSTSVLSAFFRHQHKLWDVRAGATSGQKAEAYRRWMRRLMAISTALVVVALFTMIGAMWTKYLVAALCSSN